MIYVGGFPFAATASSSSVGSGILIALLEHPLLVSASRSFQSIPERMISASDPGSAKLVECRWVYIFQREYATVDPAYVNFAGTDEFTTSVGLVIRNPKRGVTSIAHMDSPDNVEVGVGQMLSSFEGPSATLDVHLIGGFDDSSLQYLGHKNGGYSLPLCAKIVETLEKSYIKFNIQTLHILRNNTRKDSEGNAYPICSGFLVKPATGSIIPANFNGPSRCPDGVVRRIRVTAAYEDPNCRGKLLETYDTETDRFVIAPCQWGISQLNLALMVQNYSDEEILCKSSTSPYAEAPDFVENERRKWDYIMQHPDWRETFPLNRPRVFVRRAATTWTRLPVRKVTDKAPNYR